jgi:uncharacterized Zn-finger protein
VLVIFVKKTFARKNSLIKHLRVLTGEKPFACEICEKTFSLRGSLTEHKRLHTGKKPYECEICNRTFTQTGHLADHKRTYTGEKRYSCDACHKTFSRSTGLSKHNKSAAHNEIMKSKKTNIPITQSSFVDCGEFIKEEDIKEEIKDEENVDDLSSISLYTESYIKEEIKEEVDEGQGVKDSNQDNDNLVDCSEYIQVQMNLPK